MICQCSADAGSGPSSASVAEPRSAIVSPARNEAPSVGASMVSDGGVPTVIVTRSVPGPGLVLPSLTVSVAVYEPALAYVWLGFAAVCDALPSPKLQVVVSASPSGSVEPALENCTVSSAAPVVGLADACA